MILVQLKIRNALTYRTCGLQFVTWVLDLWKSTSGLISCLKPVSSHKYCIVLSHLQAPENHSDGIVSLAIAAHYFFGEDQKSPQLHALQERFPNWTFSSGWSCTYDLFVF